jgi:hypothetical protein
VLHKLGVHAGERLIGADWTNPWGHYEDLAASFINRRILRAAGGSWRNPPPVGRIVAVDARTQIGAFVANRNAERAAWMLKDPRLALTVRHWEPFLTEPLYIWCLRPREEIAESMARVYRLAPAKALNVADEYDARIADYLYDKRWYGVVHRAILDNPTAQVGGLARFVGLPVTAEAIAHVHTGEKA